MAIGLVGNQATSSNKTTTGTNTAAYTTNNTAGNLLVCAIGTRSNAGTTTVGSVTDTAGNTWVAGPVLNGSIYWVALYYVLNAKSGANTVTVNMTALGTANGWRFTVLEYSGGASWALDTSNTNSTANNTDPQSCGALTTTHSSDLIIGCGVSAITWAAGTVPSGSSLASAGTSQIAPGITWGLQSGSGAITPNIGTSGTTGSSATLLDAAFNYTLAGGVSNQLMMTGCGA